jgi:hypothetical protein
MGWRSATHEFDVLLLALTVWAFLTSVSTTPAADFCRTVRVNLSTLSHESQTCSRSPVISSTAFDTRPPDLPPASLMDTDFAITCPLVRRRRPQIQFLSIGPYLCSTLPSDPASRRRPCASLPFTSIRLGRDSHPLAVEHARRTTKGARLKAAATLRIGTAESQDESRSSAIHKVKRRSTGKIA